MWCRRHGDVIYLHTNTEGDVDGGHPRGNREGGLARREVEDVIGDTAARPSGWGSLSNCGEESNENSGGKHVERDEDREKKNEEKLVMGMREAGGRAIYSIGLRVWPMPNSA